MRVIKSEIIYIVFILIISFFLVGELFLTSARPATFDGSMHQTIIAQFHNALADGEFPVTWSDGFANYGLPMPIIHQQTMSYLGGGIMFITNNALLSYKLVLLIATFVSSILFYIFLRFYFSPNLALLGTFVFNFAPYRIINVYTRGSLPEYTASMGIPLVLISLYLILQKKNMWGLPLLTVSTALLFLSHPFVIIVGSFLFVPYFLFNLKSQKRKIQLAAWSTIAVGIGIGLTGYYSLPLFLEIKYFYYGQAGDKLSPGHFMGLTNYFSNTWNYFSASEIYTRPHVIMNGLFESIVLIAGVVFLIVKRKLISPKVRLLLSSFIVSGILIIFMTTKYSQIVYDTFPILGGIQHPWRMFSALIFVPPIILVILVSQVKKYQFALISCLIILVALLRFPQLYSKNNEVIPESAFDFTVSNLASNNLNTIWTGETQEYPVKKTKVEIIEGDGKIVQKQIENSKRQYQIQAESPVRLVDYTFYFPGWMVYIDGVPATIEFQDQNYRGVITYQVPAGKHTVDVTFEDTKVRSLGKLLTIFSLVIFMVFLISLQLLAKNKTLRKKLAFIQL